MPDKPPREELHATEWCESVAKRAVEGAAGGAFVTYLVGGSDFGLITVLSGVVGAGFGAISYPAEVAYRNYRNRRS